MPELTDGQIIQKLRKFDTATICNVVATYPDSDICLKLYDAWDGEYYTDSSLHCMYLEFGPVCGHVATAWYSDMKPEHTKLDPWILYEHLDGIPRPIILAAKQTYSPRLHAKAGLFGGMMTSEFKALGVVGVVTDGPMRDYVEIKELSVQYLSTGLTSGHGDIELRGANIQITVAGMCVKPGDIIHMDQCGACKFPADMLPKVLEYATELIARETKEKKFFQDPGFSLKMWKQRVQATKENSTR
jgi:4-hydroxy-4-methyl-2-oxoglutarate aldolase